MGNREEYEASIEAIKQEAQRIYDSTPREEICKRYFRDYGICNGWGDQTAADYNLGSAIHTLDSKAHSEFHGMVVRKNRWHGLQEFVCPCGFRWAVDSSD